MKLYARWLSAINVYTVVKQSNTFLSDYHFRYLTLFHKSPINDKCDFLGDQNGYSVRDNSTFVAFC